MRNSKWRGKRNNLEGKKKKKVASLGYSVDKWLYRTHTTFLDTTGPYA